MRFALAFAIALQAVAAIAPDREVDSDAVLMAYQPIPGFYEGYAFFVDRPSSHISLYSPNGPLLFDAYVEVETAPSVMSIAVDSDGTVAVSYVDSHRNAAGVDLLDTKGNSIGSFTTGNYLPSHIAFGDDHSIWTFGWQRSASDPFRNATEYMSVRHYSLSGRQIGAYLPRSQFPKGMEPACEGWQEQGIHISADRIGLLACSGMTSANPEWVELDLNGNLIGRWRVGSVHRRVALTHNGHVYTQDTVNGSNQIYLFDRASSSFRPVPWTIPGMMYGTAGDELVFSDWNNGPMHFRWYKQP